jgi:hypothetical protein
MGTISDKLMRVINTKEDIRKALISKGYDVPASIPFKEYAKMILDLPCKIDDFPELPGDVTRWHFGGLTNEMMAAMDDPRIEDADHKGRFLSFKNFAWKGMSGVGGYGDENYQTFYKFTLDDYVFIASPPSVEYMNFTFRVTGLQPGNKLTLAFLGTTNTVYGTWDKDGIYTVNSAVVEVGEPVYFYNGYGATRGEFTIEILPLYPGFILGDGVDDFAVTEKELNFEDTYTVYTAFIPFQNNPTRNMILCGADSKKTFSMQYSSLVYVSFMAGNNYYINADFVNGLNLFACKRNGNNICIKNLLTNKVVTGTCGDWVENAGLYYLWKNATYASFARAGIAGQIIDNGHFTTDEEDENILNWHKKQYPWLFPDQAWTVTGKTNEDEDRATIANITGNGNDLVLSNFAFSGNSGYGEYAYNFNDTSWISIPDYGVISDKTSKSFNIKSFVLADYPVLYTAVNKDSSIKKVKIKVTNSIPGFYFGNKPANQIIDLSTDGIYEIPSYNSPNDVTQYGFRCSNVNDSCHITIEQIPEYEGYLVTDGVDDIASSNTFVYEADFTFIGEWKFIQKDNTVAGINSLSHLYIQNRYNRGATVMINSTFENKKNITDYMTFKAITSKGKGYDENWNEVDLLYGDGNKGTSGVNIGGQGGTEFCHMLFKNMALYMNKVFSKDECIKAYNYLQTIKSK